VSAAKLRAKFVREVRATAADQASNALALQLQIEAPNLNQTTPFEVADIFAGGALNHFDGELEQTNFPSFVYSLNNRAIGVTGILDRTPCPVDNRLQ
jgi:hypothetical protein